MNKKSNWTSSVVAGGAPAPDIIEEELLDVDTVILLQGHNLFGDAIYSYLLLPGRKLKEVFAKMRSGENFNPSDFGSVLAAGRDEPSAELRAEMAAQYNMMDVPMPPPPPKPVFVQPKFFDEEG